MRSLINKRKRRPTVCYRNWETIILVGPIGAQKTTQAELIAEALQIPRCSYDLIKYDYFDSVGFDWKRFRTLQTDRGAYEAYRYICRYIIDFLGQLISDHPGHVIDLGGGVHCFDERYQADIARSLFAPYPNVILLLPSPDIDTNVQRLPGLEFKLPLNEYFIRHPANDYIPKKITYTLGKTSEQVCREIMAQLVRP